MAPNHGAGRGDGWQNLRLKIKMLGGRANGVGEDEQRAERNARQVPDGVPDEGPDGVPDGARRSARREPCHRPRHF
jgi:hypothetical protein